MKRIFLTLCFASFYGSLVFAEEKQLFTAAKAVEANIEFDGVVFVDSSQSPSAQKAEEIIRLQLTHMFGPMGAAKIYAVPKGEDVIKDIRIGSKTKLGWEVKYKYTGVILVKDNVGQTYPVVLPNNPLTIYTEALVGQRAPCTDPHYTTEDDFWYFWNPNQWGCRLAKGVNYNIFDAKVKKMENTKKSYPEYHRLAQNNLIRVAVFLGKDEPGENRQRNPFTSNDENSKNFKAIDSSLRRLGFQSTQLKIKEIEEMYGELTSSQTPYVQKLVANFSKVKIEVILFFGATGIDENSRAFHIGFKNAIENASIVVYDGHSGLGSHLDIRDIEREVGRIRFPKDRYQIFFFNSCTSYHYYTEQYFQKKVHGSDRNGTENLDILSNGLATYFNAMPNATVQLLTAVVQYEKSGTMTTYQQLADKIDSNNLFNVMGDEDNQIPPRR